MKKKTLFGWVGVFAVLIMAACDFQIPESLTVQGEPGVYLPLGNPFTGDMTVTHYFNEETIKDLMGGAEAGVTLYKYKFADSSDFSGVQTYLMHYQIAKMNLDLSQYVKELDVTGGIGTPDDYIPGTGGQVSITIPLGEMTEWVTSVKGAQFIVTLDFGGEIPTMGVSVAFNINGQDQTETKDDSGNFTHPPLELKPQDHNSITINITVPFGYSFKPALDFDWESATIQPKKGEGLDYNGNYTFSIGDLINYLGKGVSFKSIPTYMYVGLPEDWEPTITLSVDGGEPVKKGIVHDSMPKLPLNDDKEIESIDFGGDALEFTDFLIPSQDNSIALSYEMIMEEIPIKNDDTLQTITIDLVIVLPLKFEIFGSPTTPGNYDSLTSEQKDQYDNFVKLELGDLLPDTGDDDLFGRTGKEDDLFESLDYVKIYLNDCHNTIVKDGFSISIIAGKTYSNVLTLNNGESDSIKIDLDELPYPFSPKFEILIPKSDGMDYGTLSIGSGTAEFDFSLVVEAKAKINQTITF
ncbi:MAG: hypothetical protein LBU17_04335 [Treponema sp.]|jgi:hypothetical protein|nr:hypothetical protein [Treponema sp.]